MNELFEQKLKRIKVLFLDLDGVLTDGRVFYGDHGDEIKAFHMQDGLGLVALCRQGIPTVVISGKKSKVNARRCKELKIYKLFENVEDKLIVFQRMLKKFRITEEEAAYVGDDWIDIPPMKLCGAAFAVNNAVKEVKAIAHHVTANSGGNGAVREVVDLILRAQGKHPYP